MFEGTSLTDTVLSASQNQVLKYILSTQYLKIVYKTSYFNSEFSATPTLSSTSSKTILKQKNAIIRTAVC
jgi:hypothetical protein